LPCRCVWWRIASELWAAAGTARCQNPSPRSQRLGTPHSVHNSGGDSIRSYDR
jgi:hypothetical protein